MDPRSDCSLRSSLIRVHSVCLIRFDSLRLINNLSVIKGQVFLGWTSTKPGLMCLTKGHNAVTLVRLEPAAPRSRVKHSTTEPLLSHFIVFASKIKSSLKCTWIYAVDVKSRNHYSELTLVMLNTLIYSSPMFILITCSVPFISMYLQAEWKQCGPWSDGFVWSQLIWIYNVLIKKINP